MQNLAKILQAIAAIRTAIALRDSTPELNQEPAGLHNLSNLLEDGGSFGIQDWDTEFSECPACKAGRFKECRGGYCGEIIGYSDSYGIGGGEQECRGIEQWAVTCGKCRVSVAHTFETAEDAHASAGYHWRKTGHTARVVRVTVGECLDRDDTEREHAYCAQHEGGNGRNSAGNGEPITRDETEQAADFARTTWESPDDFHRMEGPEAKRPGEFGHGHAMRQAFRRDGKMVRDSDAIKRYLVNRAYQEAYAGMLRRRIMAANVADLERAGGTRWVWNHYTEQKEAAKNGGNKPTRHRRYRRIGDEMGVGFTPNWESLKLTYYDAKQLAELVKVRLAEKKQAEATAF